MAAMLMYGESLREKMLKGVNDYLILKLQMILIFKVLM